MLYNCLNKLNYLKIELIIYIKMDLALNNLQRLICHKTQQINHLMKCDQMRSIFQYITPCGSHTSSIGIILLRYHWSKKVINGRYDVIIVNKYVCFFGGVHILFLIFFILYFWNVIYHCLKNCRISTNINTTL